MKECRQCGEAQPLAAYYPHKQTADGYLNICRECVKRRIRLQRLNDGEHIRAAERARARKRGQSGKHSAAYSAVARAIRKGVLVRPSACSHCGSAGRIEAAHYDYNQPLKVRWLCSRCHRRWDMGGPETRADLIV